MQWEILLFNLMLTENFESFSIRFKDNLPEMKMKVMLDILVPHDDEIDHIIKSKRKFLFLFWVLF